jgi:N-acetylglucosaminyl-diphospho-decaprenol L-rhamnosyltransferase
MISVAYLIRFNSRKKFKKDINTLKKFLFSYQSHKAGIAHKLFILIKGSEVFEKINIIRKSIPLNIPIIKLADEGYDLGSFTEFARYCADSHMFILNQHSVILKKNWLKIFNDVMKKTKSDVVGSTASFSSLYEPYNYTSNKNFFKYSKPYLNNISHKLKSVLKYYNFPNYPNPHIRTNAILVKTSIWLQYFNSLEIKKKGDTYEAESGVNSFYKFLLKNKKKVSVTRSDGKYVTSHSNWVNFVPFRNSLQNSKLIISDNHTRFYYNSSKNKKIILEEESWRSQYALENNFKLKENIKVSIVIVNFNSKNFLKNCINHLIKNNINFINKIIIVDNASTDNSLKIIPNKLVKIIKQKKNIGFAKACNIGAKYCKGKYILFLNPDTRVYKNGIKKSLQFMENSQNYKVAIMGAQMLYNKKISISCSYFPNFFRFFSKAMGLDFIFKKTALFMKGFDHQTSRFVDQVIGAFFLVRKKIFFKLNGFDERFFLFFEEVDFSLRVYNLGYKSFYNTNVKCFHHGGISTGQFQIGRDFNYHKHKIIYSSKNFNFFITSILILITFTLELTARFIKIVFIRFSYHNLKCLFLSHYYLIRWLFLKKNYQINHEN